MAVLIDGYNLLHVTGIFSDSVGPGSLKKLHAAFLDFLAATLSPNELPQTTVVFDAKGRHAASRRTMEHSGITVHYAARHEDADTLLGELIRLHHSPRQLTVVSSDHQVQRAARRRRAKAVDSDVWYAEAIRRRRARANVDSTPADSKPSTASEVNDPSWWLTQFDSNLLTELEQELKPKPRASSAKPAAPSTAPDVAKAPDAPSSPHELESSAEKTPAGDEIFPPEYLAAVQQELLNGPHSGSVERLKRTKGKRGRRT